jgi:hypothetical protein
VNTDGGYLTTINGRGEVEWHPPPQLDHGQNRINYHHRPELLLAPPDNERAPEPDREPQPEPAPEQDLAQSAQPEPEWDLPDSEQDPVWNLEWDNDFDQPTPPNVEHLWDADPSDPRLPPGWILLSGKAARGP